MKRYYFLWFLLIFALAACGGGGGAAEPAADGSDAEEETAAEDIIDPETGLVVNPEADPGTEFIVEGPISSLTLIPQTKPEFVIELPSGKRYRIRSQALSETFYEDGTEIEPHTIRQGMHIRATVIFVPDEGEHGEFQSRNLTFLQAEE